jgi:hypothetical protein
VLSNIHQIFLRPAELVNGFKYVRWVTFDACSAPVIRDKFHELLFTSVIELFIILAILYWTRGKGLRKFLPAAHMPSLDQNEA